VSTPLIATLRWMRNVPASVDAPIPRPRPATDVMPPRSCHQAGCRLIVTSGKCGCLPDGRPEANRRQGHPYAQPILGRP
jgi:hypothetical protein